MLADDGWRYKDGVQLTANLIEPSKYADLLDVVLIIMAETRVNAEIMDLNDKLGTIEEGKLAELILVNPDALKDISVLTERSNIKLVMLGGEPVIDRMV